MTLDSYCQAVGKAEKRQSLGGKTEDVANLQKWGRNRRRDAEVGGGMQQKDGG